MTIQIVAEESLAPTTAGQPFVVEALMSSGIAQEAKAIGGDLRSFRGAARACAASVVPPLEGPRSVWPGSASSRSI
jgi:hypothetical protein